MNRREVVQRLIDKTKERTYLEIGVEFGTVFMPVRAKRKVGVDPKFKISLYKKLLYPANFTRTTYFEMTSDKFFDGHSDIFSLHKIDVGFIDGLHTYEQSLKDVENCLTHLNEHGVLIMHDCNPPSKSASASSMESARKITGWNGSWCGDVWKTIVHLRSLRRDLRIFVLDCDCGLGILTKGKPESVLNFSPQDIEKMDYNYLNNNKKDLLNLKNPAYFENFLKKFYHV